MLDTHVDENGLEEVWTPVLVRDIMTPRSVAFLLQEDTTVGNYLAMEEAKQFSRVPLFSVDKDNIVGFILKDEVMHASADGADAEPLKKYALQVETLNDSMPLPALFKLMTKSRLHLYIVQDEFANVIGLVTLEDLLEEMLGLEIMDETDSVSDLQAYARQRWEARARKLGLID